MDNKYDKKKESIDEILSDLNGLLNKMPSILDGIKMPEMQPAEYVKPAEAPEPKTPASEPQNKVPAEPFDADKTVVLESFSGLSEGAQAPEELPSFQAADADSPAEEEKPLVIESFPEPQEAAPAKEQEKLAVQSLGDFMFGEEAQAEKPAAAEPVKLSGAPLEPPSEEPVRNVASGPSLSISEFTPPAIKEDVPAAEMTPAAIPEAGLPGIPEPAPDDMTFSQGSDAAQAGASAAPEPSGAQNDQFSQQVPDPFNADEAGPEKQPAPASFETSRDFGVPDIDVLMQMSEAEKPAPEPAGQPLPEAGLNPEPAPETDGPALAGGFHEAFDTAAPRAEAEAAPAASEGEIPAASEPEMEKSEPAQPEAASAAMEPGDFVIEPEAKPEEKTENPFEAFTFDPASPEPASAQDGGETLRLEPAPEAPETPAAEPQPAGAQPAEPEFAAFAEPAAEPKLEAGPEIQFGASAEPAAEPKLEVGEGIQFVAAAEQAAGSGIELAPGIELGGGSPASFGNPDETLPGSPPAEQKSSGDETLVIPPSAGSEGEEEKTVIFQASPSSTARAQAGDLASLSARQQPEGIPPERVRSIAFLYSSGDETLCASVLAELDAICLKSAAKPMFVKRAYVKVCDTDANANFVSQSVTDSGAIGLVCVGAIPQEKVYEIENALSSAGGFFRYFDSASFSHSSALDLVADLIIR